MIVTCPSCETSFAVDESLLGEQGRKVRCSECGHRWHQLPEQPETSDATQTETPDAEASEEQVTEPDTPESAAAPDAPQETEAEETPPSEPEESPEETTPPPVRGPKLFESEDEDVLDDGDRRFAVLGWSIFFVVLVLLASGFYFGQGHIVAFEPRFQKLYDLVGMTAHDEQDEAEVVSEVPGEGLSIPADKLLKSRKRVDGEPMIVVEGTVVNETDQDRPVPTLRATVSNAESEILARWYFEAAAAQVSPGNQVTFATSIADSWGRQGIGISIIFVSEETAENEPSILPSAVKE